jgi:hypothetical protein
VAEDLLITHESLPSVRFLESRILPIDPALCSLEKVLDSLELFGVWLSVKEIPNAGNCNWRETGTNLRNQVDAYRQNALFLKQRIRNTAELIVDVLQLKNQFTAQKDSFNVRVIAMLTMFYLPCSFVSVSLGFTLCCGFPDSNISSPYSAPTFLVLMRILSA